MREWSNWRYCDWFFPLETLSLHPTVNEAERYLVAQHIENHAFFELASSSRDALRTWVSQEIVVTGFFSQALLRVAAMLDNVHVRSMMVAVIDGEHGRVERGIARWSHPWLLHQLARSMNLDANLIVPLDETREFVNKLNCACEAPLTGVAALGMGNERLLLPEYAALRKCFEKCWPECEYGAFLDANLTADEEHAHLLGVIASALIANGGDPAAYLRAARDSVDSRIAYHDRLLARFASGTTSPRRGNLSLQSQG